MAETHAIKAEGAFRREQFSLQTICQGLLPWHNTAAAFFSFLATKQKKGCSRYSPDLMTKRSLKELCIESLRRLCALSGINVLDCRQRRPSVASLQRAQCPAAIAHLSQLLG